MKVLILSSFTTSLFWFRIDMMKAFLDAGCEVVAVAEGSEEEWKARFNVLGIKYRSIPVQRNGTNPLRDFKTLRAVKKLISEEQPNKIFAYQAKTVIYGGIAANRCGVKDFYPLIAGVGSVFLGSGIKNAIIRRILIAEYKLGMRNAPGVFFQNEDDLNIFVKNGIVLRDNTVILNGSGVNLEHFSFSEVPSRPTFLCISRLIRDKGIMEYLLACREVRKSNPQVRCMLVGPFDTNPSAISPAELQEFIDDGSIEYFGEQSDVRQYLKECTVFVLPSYHEGTPKTVLEAMATGRAIITTDAPGCRQTVEHGKNGLIIPVKDVKALVDAMRCFVRAPLLVRSMGLISREFAEERYDVHLINSKILDTMYIGRLT